MPTPVRASAALPGGRLKRAALLCCLGLIFAVYSNTLQNGFFLDDYTYVVQNSYIQDLRSLPKFFTSAAANSTQEEQAQYRPLFPATFAIDYWWSGGMNPAAMHFSQTLYFLLLYLGIVKLMHRLLALVIGDTDRAAWIALFAALLYGLHPINTELVNYLSARSELLSAAGAVWSLVAFLSQPRLRRRGLWLLPMLIGSLAKPVALVTPALWLAGALLLGGWVTASGDAPATRRIATGAASAFAIATAAFLILRHLDGALQHYGGQPVSVYLQQQCWSWVLYLGLFFWPAHLSADYPQNYFTGWLDWHCLAGAAGSAVLLAGGTLYAWWRPRCGRLALFGILWYFIALAPSSSVIPLSELIREYRCSFPAVGLLIAAVAVTADVIETRPGLRRAALAAGCALLAAAGFATHLRNRVWHDEISIYADALRKHPDDLRARLSLGRLYLLNGRTAEGRQLLLDVERSAGLTPWLCMLLGDLYLEQRDPERAEHYFKLATGMPPVNSQAHYAYAHFLDSTGRTREATQELEAGLALAPANFNARSAVMILYLRLGDYPDYCRHGRILMQTQGREGEFPSPYCLRSAAGSAATPPR